MNTPFTCSDIQPRPLSRRDLLKTVAAGFGWMAFGGLSATLAARDATTPPVPGAPHFRPRARRVIFLCMQGGPASQDTFDPKPRLRVDDGKPSKARGGGAKFVGSPFEFRQHGRAGLWISELFPHLAREADSLCVVHSMTTDIPNHPQAYVQMHTGSARFTRPSMGSWVLYGLGSQNENLPGFINISPPMNFGSQAWGSAFLPAMYQGTKLGAGGRNNEGISYLKNPRLSTAQQRRQVELIQAMNRDFAARTPGNHEVEGVIESYELAFRMQTEVPGLLDLSKESPATRARYGIGTDATDGFGRQCLLARRFAEAGVRFIEVNLGGWDQHANLKAALQKNCRAIDQPVAALLSDLRERGLLEDTLVVWGGEFGRTPDSRVANGRDHNARGFTMWLAGGGVKGGLSYGATDDHGGAAVESPVHIHDLHATLLHCLGLDHEKLTYRYGGRDYRLTDVHGDVVKALLA
jgi:hypothetical protein